MAGFLYFIPKATSQATFEEMVEAGLGFAFDRRPAAVNIGGSGGPNGAHGIIVADPATPANVNRTAGYYPDRQTWQVACGGKHFVGHWNDAEPGPAELIRSKPLSGHWVTLGDGQPWLIPVARKAVEIEDGLTTVSGLPQRSYVDELGKWQPGAVIERYAELWAIATRWWDAVIEEGTQEGSKGFDFHGGHEAAMLALQANYRIGAEGASLLGLLSDALVGEILMALVDWPTRLAWLKKKAAADGLNSPAGLEGGTRDIGQAS